MALAASEAVLHHGTADLTDFSVAFVVVAVATLGSVPVCALLSPHAGDEMTGR
jgi:hypothetical protein